MTCSVAFWRVGNWRSFVNEGLRAMMMRRDGDDLGLVCDFTSLVYIYGS